MKSIKHRQLQELVKNYYKELGWFATEEHSVNGKRKDVLAQNIKTKYAVANEIELSPRHCLENIRRDFKVGCNEVIIICENKTTLKEIKKKTKIYLDEYLLSKVRFRLINELIPHIHIRDDTK